MSHLQGKTSTVYMCYERRIGYNGIIASRCRRSSRSTGGGRCRPVENLDIGTVQCLESI